MAEIEEKDAEIKRLKDEEAKVVKELQALGRLVDSLITEKGAEIDAMAKLAVLLKADIAEKDAEIERLKALLTGAAEMLETLGCKGPAVAELRKAAQ